jgi:hypothetical protein
MSVQKKPSLAQRATPQLMKVVNGRDKNTRGLAKVVSAYEYLCDEYFGGCEPPPDAAIEGSPELSFLQATQLVKAAKNNLVQDRRNLGVALLAELDRQSREVRA